MMSDREELLDDLANGAETPGQEEPEKIDDAQAGPEPESTEQGDPPAAVAALLDSLSADPSTEQAAPEAAPQTNESNQEEAAQAQAQAQLSPEQEEEELLDGIKSDRGRARIKEKLSELRAKSDDIRDFREMVQSSFGNPQDFALALEFGRLANSNSEADVRRALDILDQQRAVLALRAGVDAPGVDLLADFPDLQQAVEDMTITREKAIELAKYKHRDQMAQSQAEAQRNAAIESQRWEQDYRSQIDTLTQNATAYFNTRASEVDYPAKMKAITEYFSKPENVQRFVANFQPSQWLGQFQFMYENIRTAAVPARGGPQPLRSRPTHSGQPATDPNAPLSTVLTSALDSLGI